MLKFLKDAKLGIKVYGTMIVVMVILLVGQIVGYIDLKSGNNDLANLYDNHYLAAGRLSDVNTKLNQIRGDLYKLEVVPGEAAATQTSIQTEIAAINQDTASYRTTNLQPAEVDGLNTFDA